jgi:hypothetical protein
MIQAKHSLHSVAGVFPATGAIPVTLFYTGSICTYIYTQWKKI